MDATAAIEELRRTPDRAVATTVALAMLVLAFFAVSFLLGPSNLSPADLFSGLFSGQGSAGVIAREIRLPRAALGLVVGAALGARACSAIRWPNPASPA